MLGVTEKIKILWFKIKFLYDFIVLIVLFLGVNYSFYFSVCTVVNLAYCSRSFLAQLCFCTISPSLTRGRYHRARYYKLLTSVNWKRI